MESDSLAYPASLRYSANYRQPGSGLIHRTVDLKVCSWQWTETMCKYQAFISAAFLLSGWIDVWKAAQHMCAADRLQYANFKHAYKHASSGVMHSERVRVNNRKLFWFLKWSNHDLWACELIRSSGRQKHNQEACFHSPGCTCLTQEAHLGSKKRERAMTVSATKITPPGLFAHTITPMSLTLSSCDLLPSLSQHSSATGPHCQDSERAKTPTDSSIFSITHTQTNNCGAGAGIKTPSWIQTVHDTPPNNTHMSKHSFISAFLHNWHLREECAPFKTKCR